MTSALRGREGGWSKRVNSTDRLREWDSDKGGGGQKIRNFCGCHLNIAPKSHNQGQTCLGSTATNYTSSSALSLSTCTTTSTITSITSATTSSSCASVPNSMLDVGNDEVLSEILEGVIDIQEILPNPASVTSSTSSVTATIPSEPSKSTMSSEIESIEKFLVGSSSNGSTASISASAATLPVSDRYQQSQSHQRHRSGPITRVGLRGSYTRPIQTTASSSESSSLAASNNNHQQAQRQEAHQQHQLLRRQEQSTHHAARRQISPPGLHSAAALSNREMGRGSSAPVALVPRMNELLQQVPPNVSIPDCPDLVRR